LSFGLACPDFFGADDASVVEFDGLQLCSAGCAVVFAVLVDAEIEFGRFQVLSPYAHAEGGGPLGPPPVRTHHAD